MVWLWCKEEVFYKFFFLIFIPYFALFYRYVVLPNQVGRGLSGAEKLKMNFSKIKFFSYAPPPTLKLVQGARHHVASVCGTLLWVEVKLVLAYVRLNLARLTSNTWLVAVGTPHRHSPIVKCSA